MAHVWWHNCLTVGDSAGEIPLKLKAGKRGAGTNAFALPHGLTKEQEAALKKAADAKYLELVNLFRQPQESIVFHPVPDPPGE
jgi:hypothetical protein